jgi:hypothetical protein
VEQAARGESVRVFISHTTRDERDHLLAQKLAAALRARGVEVWIAPESIPAGERWKEGIVAGIMRSCSHLLVILSAASIEADWVLREIQLAKKRYQQDPGFKILPLAAGKLPPYRNSEFINSLQWVRYHNGFHDQLAAVLSVLGRARTVTGRAGMIIEDKTRDFVGRKYVFEAINSFMGNRRNGYFTITGDPGAGKTSILAEFVKRTGCVAHFNLGSEGINTTRQFMQTVCGQLIDRFGLPYSATSDDDMADGTLLSRLLFDASQALGAGDRLIIGVDALDEVDLMTHPAGVNVLYLPATLPKYVYFVLATRKVTFPFKVEVPHEVYSLSAEHDLALEDVKTYIRLIISREGVPPAIARGSMNTDDFVATLAHKSEGNFMYLRHVLPEIRSGAYENLSIDVLPRGLEAYYDDHWRRMGMMVRPLPRTKIRIVYVLAEAQQAVSRKLIADFASDTALTVDELSVQEVLDEWKEFLSKQVVEATARYSIYHASFRDFLHRKDIVQAAGVTIQGVHRLIAGPLWQDLFGGTASLPRSRARFPASCSLLTQG